MYSSLGQGLETADVAHHAAHVGHGLYHVTGAGLALGADHRGSLGDTAQGLAQVLGSADEGYAELGLVDVVYTVGGGEHLALVDVIDLQGLEYLGLYEMSDADLGHDGDADCILNAADHLRVAHAGYSAGGTDVRGYPLESHYCGCTCLFCNLGLLGSGDVHDDAAFEHLGQVLVQLISVVHNTLIK